MGLLSPIARTATAPHSPPVPLNNLTTLVGKRITSTATYRSVEFNLAPSTSQRQRQRGCTIQYDCRFRGQILGFGERLSTHQFVTSFCIVSFSVRFVGLPLLLRITVRCSPISLTTRRLHARSMLSANLEVYAVNKTPH